MLSWAGPRIRTASASSDSHRLDHVPLRSCAVEPPGVSHLHHSSFIGAPSAYASARCRRLPRRIRDALHFIACPRWPTPIRRPGVPCASEKGVNRPACTSSLARISNTAQSVRDPDASNCRSQQPPAPWLQNFEVPPTRFIINGGATLEFESEGCIYLFILLLIYFSGPT